MPELPEVETIRKDLEKNIVKKSIKSVEVKLDKLVKNKKNYFVEKLKNHSFIKIERIGKLLIFNLDNGLFLLVHLKMTGQLIYCLPDSYIAGGHVNKSDLGLSGRGKNNNLLCLPNKYSHIMIHFVDSSTLFYNDLRQFGYLKIVDTNELKEVRKRFGIDPVIDTFEFDDFENIFKKRTINVKSLLLNQKVIAGLGNIYVDEVLFASGVRPTRSAKRIKKEEKIKIFNNIKKILKKAIEKRGTTFSDYLDSNGKEGNFSSHLKVYGRGGKKCVKCKNILKKIKVGQRGTVYCKKCQQ